MTGPHQQAARRTVPLFRKLHALPASKNLTRTQRMPDLIVPGKEGPYLKRWHLIPRNPILTPVERSALGLLLAREIMAACSNEKAAIYERIHGKLAVP